MNRALAKPFIVAPPQDRFSSSLLSQLNSVVDQTNALVKVGATLTAAPTLKVKARIHPVTGTGAINTIVRPPSAGGDLWLLALGAWSLTTAGNISLAVTLAAGEAIALIFDGAKWWPNVSSTAISSGGGGTSPFLFGSAPPVTGTYSQGAIMFNTAPIPGGNIGWVNVSAGTPGTWKEWGPITTGGGGGSGGSGPSTFLFGSAAPTTGTYSQGAIIFNTAPLAGGNIGWVNVVGGTPGIWKEWGPIAV